MVLTKKREPMALSFQRPIKGDGLYPFTSAAQWLVTRGGRLGPHLRADDENTWKGPVQFIIAAAAARRVVIWGRDRSRPGASPGSISFRHFASCEISYPYQVEPEPHLWGPSSCVRMVEVGYDDSGDIDVEELLRLATEEWTIDGMNDELWSERQVIFSHLQIAGADIRVLLRDFNAAFPLKPPKLKAWMESPEALEFLQNSPESTRSNCIPLAEIYYQEFGVKVTPEGIRNHLKGRSRIRLG